MSDNDQLDGCNLDFTFAPQLTGDDQVDALVMFADCWHDANAVEQRRIELIEWSAADV